MVLQAPRSSALRSRLPSLLSGLACAALGSLSAPPVSAGEPAETLHVSVTAPAGKGCISGDKLESSVQKRVGRAPRRTSVDVLIESADPAPGWVAEVAVAGRAGRRSVRTQSSSCSKLDDGLVLVVMLLVDPEQDEDPPPSRAPKGDEPAPAETEPGGSWGTEKPAEEEPAAGDGPRARASEPEAPEEEPENGRRPPKKPAGDKPAPTDKPSPDKPRPKGEAEGDAAAKPKKLQFGLGASVVYASGLVPGGLAGLRAAVSWLSPTPVPLEASFTYYFDHDEDLSSGSVMAGRHARTMAFAVTSCPGNVSVGRLFFGACAGMTFTRLQHHFYFDDVSRTGQIDYMGPYTSQTEHFMISPTADLRFDISLWKFLRIGAGLEVMTPINRPDGDPGMLPYVRQVTEPVIFQGRLGISLVLPP